MSADRDQLEGIRTRTVRIIREATGLHESLAMPIAAAIIESFRREFGGERVYFGTRDPAVDDQVLAEFNGRNRDELCHKYDISLRTFYRIIQRSNTKP